MHESSPLYCLVPEDSEDNHLSVLHNSSLQQYKLSLTKSNITSNNLLNDVWETHKDLFNSKGLKSVTETVSKLLQSTDNKSRIETWNSSLSEYTKPEILLECTLNPCTKCTTYTNECTGFEQFQANKCECDLNVLNQHVSQFNTKPESLSNRTLSTAGLNRDNLESRSNEEKNLFKPKFGRQKLKSCQASTLNQPVVISQLSTKTITNIDDTSLEKEEEENKSHIRNVAKITFKTAKEHLASNPAYRRVLGASRKAQAKFIPPMIGPQDKKETNDPIITDERLKYVDPKMIELIESEIIDRGVPIGWDDIAGLDMAKSVIQEAIVWPLLRPDIFTGLRRPPKGILLFGPPGTGKTLIGKCIASQCRATFFSISASSLTSKWIGDGEKMVRALFAVASCHQPAVIFIDEIDSLLTQRSDSEHEATRRIKTEFLVQFDGAATEDEDRLLIVGATNRPHELDEAARRRLVKRLYIPLPDCDARSKLITNLLKNESNDLSLEDVMNIANLTDGYSGADMKSLCSEAAMGPIRSVPLSQIVTIDSGKVRPVNVQDFKNALQRVRPSVSQDDLGQYVKWNKTYGQGF